MFEGNAFAHVDGSYTTDGHLQTNALTMNISVNLFNVLLGQHISCVFREYPTVSKYNECNKVHLEVRK